MPIGRTRLGVLLASMLGCHGVVHESDVHPSQWSEAFAQTGVSSVGYSYDVHRRPRAHERARTYFVFVDPRCRVIGGELLLMRGADSGPIEELFIWDLPAASAYAELAPGTWYVQGWPDARPSKFTSSRVLLDLSVTAEHDTVVIMTHVALPRAEPRGDAYDRTVSRRFGSLMRRCFAGADREPGFDVQLEPAWRCADVSCVAPGG